MWNWLKRIFLGPALQCDCPACDFETRDGGKLLEHMRSEHSSLAAAPTVVAATHTRESSYISRPPRAQSPEDAEPLGAPGWTVGLDKPKDTSGDS